MLGGVIRAPVPPLGAVLEPGKLGWKRSVQQDDGLQPYRGCLWKQSPRVVGLAPRPWLGTGFPSALQQKENNPREVPAEHPAPGPHDLAARGQHQGLAAAGTPLPTPSHPIPPGHRQRGRAGCSQWASPAPAGASGGITPALVGTEREALFP